MQCTRTRHLLVFLKQKIYLPLQIPVCLPASRRIESIKLPCMAAWINALNASRFGPRPNAAIRSSTAYFARPVRVVVGVTLVKCSKVRNNIRKIDFPAHPTGFLVWWNIYRCSMHAKYPSESTRCSASPGHTISTTSECVLILAPQG